VERSDEREKDVHFKGVADGGPGKESCSKEYIVMSFRHFYLVMKEAS
jgi:hypothetical protein